jgi:dipeptidase E
MQRSGFHDLIRPLLEGGVVYAGESAGAVIAGPTLRGVQQLDDPAEAEDTVWEGLDLIDVGVVPHWGNEKFAAALELCRAEMSQHADTITITDQEVLVIDGERRKIS